MSCKFTLAEHIIHHEILGVGIGSGGDSTSVGANSPLFITDGYIVNIPPASDTVDGYLTKEDYARFFARSGRFRMWQYQDFAAPATTPITLSAFENGTGLVFDSALIIDSTAVVVQDTNNEKPPSTTVAIPGRWLPSNRVSVAAHTGTSVTLNQNPVSTQAIRVFYIISLPASTAFPDDYLEAPKFVREQRVEFLDEAYVNQEGDETIYDTKTFADNVVVDGYVLTSDSAGVATWQSSSVGVQIPIQTSPPGSPSGGDLWIGTPEYTLYVYDGTRGKWLTSERVSTSAARNSNNTTNVYLRTDDGVATNIAPFVLPWDATLVSMSASGEDIDTWTAQVHLAGSLVAGATLAVIAASSASSDTLNIDFSSGDAIQIFMSGTSIARPRINLFFARRGS